MTKVINYQSQDGRNQHSHPTLDEIRSQVGAWSGYISAGTTTTLVTIEAGKVFHLTTVIIGLDYSISDTTAQIRLNFVGSAASSGEIERWNFGNTASTAFNQNLAVTQKKGSIIVASTITRFYLVASVLTQSATVFVGGILRNRTNEDSTTTV